MTIERKLRDALAEICDLAEETRRNYLAHTVLEFYQQEILEEIAQKANEVLIIQPPTSDGRTPTETPLTDALCISFGPSGDSEESKREKLVKHSRTLERTLHAKERELADRDTDWILAMAAAFGADSGCKIPIVPKPEVFRECFAALQSASAAPQEGKPAMKRFYELCESFRKNESDGNMYRKLESLYFDVAQELDILRATPMGDGDEKVICPECCHQFRAIPVQVQNLMLDAGFEPPFTAPPAATDGFVRVPDTKIDLSEDELMDVLKKTSPYMTEKQYKALTVTRWKDSIDVDYPNEAFRILAHFVLLAAAHQSGKNEDGSNG